MFEKRGIGFDFRGINVEKRGIIVDFRGINVEKRGIINKLSRIREFFQKYLNICTHVKAFMMVW
jgi:hypothetical protein